MPIKSKAQQRFLFAAEARGELPEGTAERWVEHTHTDLKKLPEHVKKKKKKHGHVKHAFAEGFEKVARIKLLDNPKTLEYAGLGTLAAFPAMDIAHGVKKKDKGEVARGAAEVGGLGLLARAVAKSKH